MQISHTSQSISDVASAEALRAGDAVDTATPSTPRPRAKRRRPLVSVAGSIPAILLGLSILLLWELLVRSGSVSAFLLPYPADVARSFWESLNSGLFWKYARTTLAESMLGFATGAAIALPIGYGIARSRILARTLEPYLAASQAMPSVAIAPVLVIWLGYGLKAVVVLCALIVFFPIVVNTALGLRTIDRDVIDAARVDGAHGWSMLLYFEAPLAMPAVLTGLRTGLTLSIIGAVVGEFILGDQGLGGLLTIARSNFDTPLVFATLFMLMLLASSLYGVARFIEAHLLRILGE
ncbi:MAG: ABC transporter permease [Thermomicrobiales bacterium]|nr:ABC transporter permease [Thermomicrobiales bacterium]